MRIAFAGTVPKSTDYPDANEDCFAISEDSARIVVSDGASESFDSKAWARRLVEQFIDNPEISPAWVAKAVSGYAASYDPASLSWSKQAAYERGSFATLLGVEINQSSGWLEIIAIGDTLAMLVDEQSIVSSWPYTTAEQFDERPALLSTNPALNSFVGELGFYQRHQISWDLQPRTTPILLCMTDALGQWALRMALSGDGAWTRLVGIDSVDALSELVITERAAKRMRIDDSTLVVLRFDQGDVPS